MYNIGYNVGQVSIESYVVEYTEKDLENLNTIWKPTDTKYISKDEIIQAELADAEKARLELEKLKK